MKISGIELIHIEIPLKKPFETSFGRITARPAIIVKMTADDGTVGYGESSLLSVAISEPETIEDGFSFLEHHAKSLIGVEVSPDIDITTYYPSTSYPVSRLGLEGAYLDLAARTSGMPIQQLFGSDGDRVPLGESASLRDTVEEVVEEVRSFVTQGVKRVKLKIAPGRDIKVAEAVRRAFPDLELGVDTNAAYKPADIDLLARLAPLDLSFIEQPFAAADLASHILLRKKGIPVCLDESVSDLTSCRRAIAEGACDMVNIKPARVGGFQEAKHIHDECVRSGIRLFGGGRLETGIGKTANAAFYSLPGFTDASDITPPTDYLVEDIITPPFATQSGEYVLPKGHGLGVDIDEPTLAKYTKRRVAVAQSS